VSPEAKLEGAALEGKRILVIGLERSGRAASEILLAKGATVVAFDINETLDVGRLRELGVEVHQGREEEKVEMLLAGTELVVKSPGVPGQTPLVLGARDAQIPVWSELELGARLLPNPFIAITGSNGKTTTTALLGEMFRASGVPAEVVGNIGRAVTSVVGSVDDSAWIVCEVGVQQLDDVDTFRPRVAVLLNLVPDHLDLYGTFEWYADTKLRIFEQQTEDDLAIVPLGFGPIPGGAVRMEFSGDDPLPAEPLIPGAHNRENAAAATAAARAAGIPDDAIAEALRTFPGVPHRIERIRVHDGVLYVNDSKATNVAAALRALAALRPARLHVILGGLGKNESYAPLAEAFEPGDRAYLIGAAAPEIAAALEDAGAPYVHSGDLEVALTTAAAAAVAGDVVLLSPACASFDQFRDYEARGDEFRRLVRELT
jgi:UDP-N-acetylmuramoylalanine--D-glutamate ligase